MKFYEAIYKIFARPVRALYRVRVIGAENLPAEGGCLLCSNHTSMRDVVVLAAALPPNRGELTVAEFAENVNFYRGYFDYGQRWSLDENGEWAENQYENVVYFGGGDGPAPFTYTVEEGTLRAVHWAYTETAETIYGTGDENARMAYLALAAAQKGTSLFNIRGVVKQIGSNSWAGDADYSAAWKNVEMRYDARIEGEYYYLSLIHI